MEKVPTGWVHGRVPIALKASVAAGITGRVLAPSGRLLASGTESGSLIHLGVKTRLLRSNRASRLRAIVYFNGQQACPALSFRLKVDNTPPRLSFLRTTTDGHLRLASFKVSEKSQMRIEGGGSKYRRWVGISGHRVINALLSLHVHKARLIVRDRAGNTIARKLVW